MNMASEDRKWQENCNNLLHWVHQISGCEKVNDDIQEQAEKDEQQLTHHDIITLETNYNNF